MKKPTFITQVKTFLSSDFFLLNPYQVGKDQDHKCTKKKVIINSNIIITEIGIKILEYYFLRVVPFLIILNSENKIKN